MLRKNDILEVTIDADSGNGSGICRVDGLAVFIWGTTRGDRVKIKIVNVK
ncbi:MAG: TRAM domain-containing protein, partial [Ruminococcaceae bacterium]|nr:TRAM domain-containing protein [Oscillospiraceae bacterium]